MNSPAKQWVLNLEIDSEDGTRTLVPLAACGATSLVPSHFAREAIRNALELVASQGKSSEAALLRDILRDCGDYWAMIWTNGSVMGRGSRFQAKEWRRGAWCACDTLDGDEPLFGDNMPRDQREAEQCARAANIAHAILVEDMRKRVLKAIGFVSYP